MQSKPQARQEALEQLWQQGLHGHELLTKHTGLVDRFIIDRFKTSAAVEKAGNGIALIALGGYGRQELYPFSDIDLLLLHERKVKKFMQEAAESILYPLWDAGFEVGHSVRTVKDAVSFAREDFIFQVSLLDARLLVGSEDLHQELLKLYRKKVLDGGREQFVRTMDRLCAERRQKYGAHAYLLEPNIKEGRGGMRDIQAMLWTAKAVFGLNGLADLEHAGLLTAEERQSFAAAWDMLAKARNRLHYLSRRHNDQLFFEHQEEMAAAFGCQDQDGLLGVEHFMRQVYQQFQTVAVTTNLFFEQVHENLGLTGKSAKEQELEPDIAVRAGTLRLAVTDAGLAERPFMLMRLFLQAGRSNLPIHHRSRQLVSRNLHLADKEFRASKRTAKAFASLLLSGNAPPALEAMLETGLLPAYIPEFAKVESLAQHDLYHIYTVDRHQIQTVGELDQLRQSEPELFAGLTAPHLLYLAALLHDIGKGQRADHSLLGADKAAAVAARMGYAAEDQETLAFLIRRHLFLPENALRRDLSDRDFIREAAEMIGSTERLIMLHLLSVADSKATGPSAWSDWKASLMTDLFLKLRACLEAGCTVAAEHDAQAAQGEAWLRGQVRSLLLPEERLRIGVEELPADYLTSFTPESVVRHLRLHRDQAALLQQKVLLFPEEQHGSWPLLMLCQDRQGLLAKLCGVLALHNLSVLAARIFTWPDGTVVDALDLLPQAEISFAEQDWRRLESDLNRAVNYRLDVGFQLHSKLERLGHVRRVQQTRNEALISNEVSRDYTVIEVYGGERPGALYQLTQTLSDFRLNIHRARIATEVEQLIDIFYVTAESRSKVEDQALLEQVRHALLHVIREEE
jgi:[protein-PII] uridylyltransferase